MVVGLPIRRVLWLWCNAAKRTISFIVHLNFMFLNVNINKCSIAKSNANVRIFIYIQFQLRNTRFARNRAVCVCALWWGWVSNGIICTWWGARYNDWCKRDSAFSTFSEFRLGLTNVLFWPNFDRRRYRTRNITRSISHWRCIEIPKTVYHFVLMHSFGANYL